MRLLVLSPEELEVVEKVDGGLLQGDEMPYCNFDEVSRSLQARVSRIGDWLY